MVFNLGYVQTTNRRRQKMQANHWQLQSPCGCGDAMGAHCPMEHIQGFTRSYWVLPLGECLRRIAPAAVMVDEFVENTKNTNKKLFSASNLWYNQPLVVCENLIPQNGPSNDLINATSCVKCAMPQL
jgi:hypothetical protein